MEVKSICGLLGTRQMLALSVRVCVCVCARYGQYDSKMFTFHQVRRTDEGIALHVVGWA